MRFNKAIFQRKDIKDCVNDDSCLTQTFGTMGLIILGIGAILGAGIFVVTGLAAAVAGPAIIFSFLGAAAVCVLVSLCFAELGSIITITGGVYTYTQFALGEVWAWIVGWSVLLQIIVTASTVAIGWSSYIVGFLNSVNIYLPDIISKPPMMGSGLINLPALSIVTILTVVVMLGAKNSNRVNSSIVLVKLIVIVIFIIAGAGYIHTSNYIPFVPMGLNGILQGAAMVFFAYLGFEAVATSSEEAKNPKKSIPIGIIGSLLICASLYILVVVIMTGMVKYTEYSGVAAPVQYALTVVGANWIMAFITTGIIAGLTTVILVNIYIIPRVIYSMSRDGLLPIQLTKVSAKYNVPVIPVLLSGIVIGILAAFLPIGEVFELANIAALTAFIFIAIGLINLRRNCPEIPRKFKCPFVPILPIITIIICLILIIELKISTILNFGLWVFIGIVIYFGYRRFKTRKIRNA